MSAKDLIERLHDVADAQPGFRYADADTIREGCAEIVTLRAAVERERERAAGVADQAHAEAKRIQAIYDTPKGHNDCFGEYDMYGAEADTAEHIAKKIRGGSGA